MSKTEVLSCLCFCDGSLNAVYSLHKKDRWPEGQPECEAFIVPWITSYGPHLWIPSPYGFNFKQRYWEETKSLLDLSRLRKFISSWEMTGCMWLSGLWHKGEVKSSASSCFKEHFRRMNLRSTHPKVMKTCDRGWSFCPKWHLCGTRKPDGQGHRKGPSEAGALQGALGLTLQGPFSRVQNVYWKDLWNLLQTPYRLLELSNCFVLYVQKCFMF